MPRFYVTAWDPTSNAGTGRLSRPLHGPHDSEPEARQFVEAVRAKCVELDPFHYFLAFGVTAFYADMGEGMLNNYLPAPTAGASG